MNPGKSLDRETQAIGTFENRLRTREPSTSLFEVWSASQKLYSRLPDLGVQVSDFLDTYYELTVISGVIMMMSRSAK